MDLYITVVDFTKEFDTVSREGLWKIMATFDCPPRFIAMVREFHDGVQARVQNDGGYSEPFPVTNKAVLCHQQCSACFFLQCSQMRFTTVMVG